MSFEPTLDGPNVQKPNSHRLDGYRQDGGYAAFEALVEGQ